MANEQQHTDTTDSFEQEPLTVPHIIMDTPIDDNTKKLTSSAEVDLDSVSNGDTNASAGTKATSTADSKRVSIAEPSEEQIGVDTNLKAKLPEGEDLGDTIHDNIDTSADIPMEVNEKKKKSKKRKPKSQRGLVRS